MALSTLDILEQRLLAAGLGGTTNTAATPKSLVAPSASSNYSEADKADQLKWFSSSVNAPFFISPKHDGVRLISYVSPTTATGPPSAQQASSKTKTGAATVAPPPLMTCYSRYGRPIYGLFWIEEELRLLRALCGDASLIIDGELYLHQTDMDASRGGREGRANASDGRKRKPARTALPSSDADGVNSFNTGFLAVSALVNRFRSSTFRCASKESVLKYVPSLPRLCVFDVPSYNPCANPLAPPTRNAPTAISAASRLHVETKASVKYDGSPQQVLAELQRVRGNVTDALRLNDVEQLRIVPNVTPFSQRLRTMHYLFELLSRGMKSPVLRQHFCPTSSRMCGAPTTRPIRNCRKHTPTAAQVQPPHSGIGQHHGGHFVSRIPYQLVKSLEDTTQRMLPMYLDAGYEGAVIRAPVNTYDFKEKTKGTLAALVAPLLRATETTKTRRGRHLRGTSTGAGEASGRRARNRAALLLSLNTGPVLGAATPLMVHAYRGDAPRREPMQPILPSDAGLTDAELDVLDVVAVGRRAVLQSAKLPQRSMTAVKVLTYHDREYPILRPLLKEPSKNPRTRELVSIPRSHVRALGYPIKRSTDTALSDGDGATTLTPATPRCGKKKTKSMNHATTAGQGSAVFYGLQCLAENGLVFNTSLPKMTLAQQKTLLQHLLSAGRDPMREGREAASATMKTPHNKRSNAEAPYGGAAHPSPSKIVSLTGLYATVKFSTLTEHGLPRFGSIKAIRGGKGWFM
ncbi:putative DNA ligase [Leishmania major strain Friedlin]|uniref:Putative DNA ligase n=1 Tax=Leishmania major TaxID=5664 RepID=Q4QH35_LEIMA|nr:putative DNA ligase [Leishmania major strain Friedlin]CAG9570167.1 DNA_ligase_-_putative [Leishmania major strain Friedlin]CAJ02559.1 putative DNA ligase [Leishmania major strain Friedlin]|eukprot:XP_001681513.1 putative DNA ligase [Leishmania major strain Friedlin]